MKNIILFVMASLMTICANAATVVATVDGKPVTDTDITARTKLMARQGTQEGFCRVRPLTVTNNPS